MLTNKLSSKAILQDFAKAPRKLRLVVLSATLATLSVPIFLSEYDYSVWQLILAMVLLDVCLYPTFRYVARRETGLPIMPMLCLSFAVQYATPIFTQESKIDLRGGEIFYLESQAVVAALVLSILGVILLQFTYYLVRDGRATNAIPSVSLHLSEARAEIFCIGVFCISLLLSRVQGMLTKETALQFSSFFNLMQNQLLVAIVVLAWLAFAVRKHKRHLLMLYCLVAFTALRGFSTTMLEQMILPFAMLFIGKWAFTKRLPVASLSVIGVAFLFFSPVKMEIRRLALEEAQVGQSSPVSDRVGDWVTQASEFWWESMSGRRRLSESTASASSRTDLIHQFAHIYAMTPSLVPYQNGTTYQYFAVTFIPRMFWPEKPLGNYTNNLYAIEYGITTEEVILTSSFGITLLGEGYANFGATGSLLTMVFLGLVLAGFEHVFGKPRAGVGGQAIFLTTFVFFLNGIGSSTEIMFGAIVQNLTAGFFLLWWFRKPASKSPVSGMKLTPSAPYKALTSD